METLLKRELGCSSVKATGHSGGGCISQGQSYDTDKGRVFVKVNSKAEVGPPALGQGRARWPEAKMGLWFGSRVCEILSWPGLGSARDYSATVSGRRPRVTATVRRFHSQASLPLPAVPTATAVATQGQRVYFFEKPFTFG